MFCSNSRLERTEKDLVRNMKRKLVNNPSTKNSIVKSLVKDLCFWEINTLESLYRKDERGNIVRTGKMRRSIPTMKEAIDMDNEYGFDISPESSPFPAATWKTAIDSDSGKMYYYDVVSRKTQWKKPSKLKQIEKEKKKERRRVARQFFDEMEKNIMDSISRGEVIPGVTSTETKTEEETPKDTFSKSHMRKHVRTISAMHGISLEELGTNIKTSRQDQNNSSRPKSQESTAPKPRGQNSALMGRPPLPVRGSSHGSTANQKRGINSDHKSSPQRMGESVEKQVGEKTTAVFDGKNPLTESVRCKKNKMHREQPNKPSKSSRGHTRRNTEGTIYLETTMTNPDVKATIKCVCGVFRAHIRQSIEDEHSVQRTKAQSSLEFDVFDDNFGSLRRRMSCKHPTLLEISEFYEAFYQRSQMEHDTIIFSLIYVERLIKSTNGILRPSPQNWRSLLFSCMVLASKVWDDFSMWNYDFANVTAHTTGMTLFTISRINELELALLKCLKFNVKVPASEYAKYYFLIRAMLLRSGLVKEDKKPLGKRDALQKLEILNDPSLDQSLPKESRDRRSKSMDYNISKLLPQEKNDFLHSVLKDSVCLEQLVRSSC